MLHRNIIAGLIATAALAVPFETEAASPIQRQCKAPITKVAQNKAKQNAQLIAKRSWSQQAEAQHGSAWASIQNAAVSKNGCSYSQAGWTCTFAAKPCRYVNTLISPDQPGLMLKRAPGGLIKP